MFSLFKGKTPPIRSTTGKGIAALEQVKIGGVPQWMTLRGHDTSNPILLYVHGGPGMSDMGAIRALTPVLEEHFLVVHWSQRGAVKSYSKAIPPESMHVQQFVSDLEELARYLLARFGHRKLFLVGQSWGSLLCMYLLKRCPELVYAYVGVNQIVDRAEEELISYRYLLNEARQRGNTKAVAQLAAIGEPVGGLYATLEGTLTQRTIIRAMGLVMHDPKGFQTFGKVLAMNSELTLGDILNMFKGLRWNMELLWKEFCQANLCVEMPEVSVPIYFIAGRHDHITSAGLQEQYINQLTAPRKGFYLFEHSGHLACFEEPVRFVEVMLKVRQENL